MNGTDPIHLKPTSILNSDHPSVAEHTQRVSGDADDPVSTAVLLYNSVRDGIRYDPYGPFSTEDDYRASAVLARKSGFCIPKAALLCTLGRAAGIPSRLGFAHLRNFQAPVKLIEWMGTDIFAFHGFVEFFLDGKWVRATPAFNREIYLKLGMEPLEFNGREDSMFPENTPNGKRFIQYTEYLGVRNDVPLDEILSAWRRIYGRERIEIWMERIEARQRTK